MFEELSPETIAEVRETLGDMVLTTPSLAWHGPELAQACPDVAEVYIKLELFQRTGTFKARAAMSNMRQLSAEQLSRGITAVSAGNHAIAAAWAARALGTSAKIFMPETAKPLRARRARDYGAELIFCATQSEMFERAALVEETEGRGFIHPFEGPATVQGTATVGLEIREQMPALDVMILPVGGGGLCGGVASFLKQTWPGISIYGVEPEGANTMALSFAAGEPVRREEVSTIADSLAPPRTEPYTFSVCREFVDELVVVSDSELRSAMRTLFLDLKLAVEPAGAASTAALLGPLRERCAARRVGVIACGANISPTDFSRLLAD